MIDPNNHINYSAADIERYLQGKMSAKEMHDMEGAALQDPFLADAIEGYTNIFFDEANKHLNEITALLQQSKEDTKVIALPSKRISWLKVAAVILLVIGAGTISWLALNNISKKEKNIAATIKNDSSQTILSKVDTAKSVQHDTNQTTIKAVENPLLIAKVSPKKIISESESDTIRFNMKSQRINAEAMPAQNSVSTATDNDSKDIISLNEPAYKDSLQTVSRSNFAKSFSANNQYKNAFTGRVINNNNQALAQAIIADTTNHLYAVTNTDGYFTLHAPDSVTVLNASIQSTGYVTANTQLLNNTSNNIYLQSGSTYLAKNVVVTGYGTKKKAVIDSAAMPLGGWQNFKEYAYKKMHKEIDTTGNDIAITADVEIEFLIDKNGQPTNFKILKSYSPEKDAAAIEALKTGPKWITTRQNSKARVSVQF